ncbi:MAG: hypothetical protein M1830_006697 [Pleopsidium flavum]|nr:MAG: hypothetical protein M1830_006697 [Pleopsidium flavum]
MKFLETSLLTLTTLALIVAAVPAADRVDTLAIRAAQGTKPCGPQVPSWPLTTFNWNAAKTDENLRIWRKGGLDTEGTRWMPLTSTATQQFSNQLGVELLNTAAWNCSIETPCDADIIDCQKTGFYPATGSTAGFKQSKWGYFALDALVNVNARSSSVYQSLQDAEANLANLQLDLGSKFGKQSSDQPDLQETLLGLSLSSGSLVASWDQRLHLLPDWRSIMSTPDQRPQNISNARFSNPLANPAKYGEFIASFSAWLRGQLDFSAGNLFKGALVGGYYIEDALAGGAWVARDTTAQASTSANLKLELMARGINALWKKSKIWVTFIDLKDDVSGTKCEADKTRPQITKYCDDGGVYYLYRFDEHGNHDGALDKPWGMEDLSSVGLNPAWVTESSAKSYRASQNGYNYDQKIGTQRILATASKSGIAQFNNRAGRLPGTWTIPVCDMGTYTKWNQDYISNPASGETYSSPLPCICGPGGSRTAAFTKEAQMTNFDTLIDWCYQQTRSIDWPAGVDKIDYGFKSIKRP